MSYEWDGKYFALGGTSEKPLVIKRENHITMTPREVISYLDKLYEQYVGDQIHIDFLVVENHDLLNKWKLSQQKVISLEEEVRRLKDRVKVLKSDNLILETKLKKGGD